MALASPFQFGGETASIPNYNAIFVGASPESGNLNLQIFNSHISLHYAYSPVWSWPLYLFIHASFFDSDDMGNNAVDKGIINNDHI